MTNFTGKQRAFIDHYLITLNGTEAARCAGYKGDDNTLGVIAHENLRKLKIKDEIERRLGEQTMSANETLRRVSDIAAGNLLNYITPWGSLDIEKMREDGAGHLLKKYKRTKRTIPRKDNDPIEVEQIEIELYGADSAHDKLMRYHGLYNDSTRIKSWKDDIVRALIDGRLKPEDVKLAYADQPDLVSEFFNLANVRSTTD